MGLLGREAILSATNLAREKVSVPEWGEADSFVFVRGLTGMERGHYEQLMGTMPKAERYKRMRGLLCAMGICDESGAGIFTPDDVDRISSTAAAPLDRCFDAIYRLSGMGDKESENIEKNSEATPGDGD